MNPLTELYNQQIVPLDDELEKEAAVMVKQAEEEEFAGRIMARGFADELNKLAAPSGNVSIGGPAPAGEQAGRAAARKKGGDTAKSMFGGTDFSSIGNAFSGGAAKKKKPTLLGSVTGKSALGTNKMPTLPGAGKKPTMVAGTK